MIAVVLFAAALAFALVEFLCSLCGFLVGCVALALNLVERLWRWARPVEDCRWH